MSLVLPPSGDDGAAKVLRAAQAHLETAIEDFDKARARVLAGDTGAVPDAERAARDYGKAAQTLFDIRKRLNDDLTRRSGIVHDYAVDFDDARAEVRRLLDRLRAARDPDPVS